MHYFKPDIVESRYTRKIKLFRTVCIFCCLKNTAPLTIEQNVTKCRILERVEVQGKRNPEWNVLNLILTQISQIIILLSTIEVQC